ncbi:hypothetical protein CGRA01v4_15069 [Colletotrichum graminicola]|uniref:PD-(D/E)XK nuclease-like domain-containing protein n=1 Tax=Colletotrichum graminicola (strain M1.001 / M2 / FGSC 10212) TaxID=645133 RepID=E3R0R2_COLGM|nr:uncharacterized protein GLRG_11849 [Colletotrichum graminicola M1.001]EFQ36700.1 hypothetical protein GLRG_11849 [Colletotrichum graminicola M1.001]WDK23777.1 hypothetical protein CGRA01v4_15069 [Colletotrichum graminicola]
MAASDSRQSILDWLMLIEPRPCSTDNITTIADGHAPALSSSSPPGVYPCKRPRYHFYRDTYQNNCSLPDLSPPQFLLSPSISSGSCATSKRNTDVQQRPYRARQDRDTPPNLMEAFSNTPKGTRKRRLRDDTNDDDVFGGDDLLDGLGVSCESDMVTPKAKLASRASLSSASLQSGSTNKSGNQSPTKQLKGAALDQTGFVVKSFLDTSVPLPTSLSQLKQDLDKIRHGIDLLPAQYRNELCHLIYPNERSSIPPHAFRSDTVPLAAGTDDWRIPSLTWVNKTVKDAAKCETLLEAEAAWNNKVHDRILSWLFRADDAEELLDYAYCPSSQILKSFKPLSAPSKMIDYCFIVRPDCDTQDYSGLVDAVRDRRHGRSINHTDLGELDRSPIALSIETKRSREEWDKATLQLGTWLSAQWRSLDDLGWKPTSAIQFLPGIIVQGHYWHFVGALRRESQVTLLSDVYIGGTADHYGVYQIVTSLQVLARWSREVFWQAFKTELLASGA